MPSKVRLNQRGTCCKQPGYLQEEEGKNVANMSRLQGQAERSQKAREDEKESEDVKPPHEGEGQKTGIVRDYEKCYVGIKIVTEQEKELEA